MILSSALDRKTEFTTTSAEAGKSVHKVLTPDGRSSESNSQDKISESSVNSLGENFHSTSAQDPRFGWMAPFSQSVSMNIANSNIALSSQVSKTADLVDAADPFSFTKLTQKTILQNDASRAYSSEYDKATRTLTTLSPLGRVNYTVLTELGLVQALQQGTLEAVYFDYDSFGRISAIKQGPRISYLGYDNLGNLNKIQDSLGRITSFKHDASGRVIEQIRPDQKSVRFTYDANGNMTSLTPADSQTHQFSFNLFELVDTYMPPMLVGEVSTLYTYNLDKQVTNIYRPDGKQIAFAYGSQSGKLESLNFPEGGISFSYFSSTGQLSSAVTADNIRSDFSYQGPLLQETALSLNGRQMKMNYTYQADAQLSLVSVTSSDQATSSVGITYDKESAPVSIGDESLSYDQQNGLLKGSSLGFISENLLRNNFGEIISANYNFNENPRVDRGDDEENYCRNRSSVFAYQLERDQAGRIIAKAESFRGKRQDKTYYTYDDLGRLTEVRNDRDRIVYQYDSNGNHLRRIEGRKIIPARYDAQDRLTKYGDTDFVYNANGDLVAKYDYGRKEQDGSRPERYDEKNKKKQVTQYFYDSLGSLRKVILPSGKVIEYLIDARNRRVGKKVNGKVVQLFMYQSQLQIAAELDGEGKLIRHFVYGSKSNIPDYFIQSGVKYKIISDHLGSPRLIINSDTGKIMAKMAYDEFGVVAEMSYKNKMTSLPFGFAGGIYDEDTELVRFGARDYDPEIGRWTTKDPIGFAGGDTNLFSYTANDPINWIDPSGLARGDWWDPRTYILPIWEAIQGSYDFGANYNNMRQANTIGADKYFHCMANCQATQRGPGGHGAAVGISEGRELFDEHIKGDSPKACNDDRAANSQGQSGGASGGACSQVCDSLRPGSLGSQW